MSHIFLGITLAFILSMKGPKLAASESDSWSCMVDYGGVGADEIRDNSQLHFEGLGFLRCSRRMALSKCSERSNANKAIRLFGQSQLDSYLLVIDDQPGKQCFEVALIISLYGDEQNGLYKGRFHVRGILRALAKVGKPRQILGKYKVIHVASSGILGVGGIVGFHSSKESIKISGGLAFTVGLGLQAGLSQLNLELYDPN